MKHFIFDMGGVLLKPIPNSTIENEDSFVKCNTIKEDEFIKIFIDYEKGNINTKEYVKILGPHFNKANLTIEEYEKDYFDIGEKYSGVFKHAYPLIKSLKEDGHKVYLLSNLHELSFKYFSSVFDVSIFDELFLSYKLHMVKPDDDIFEYVIKKINDDPSNMFFFDDKIANVNVAINCGINGLQTTGESLEENILQCKKKI